MSSVFGVDDVVDKYDLVSDLINDDNFLYIWGAGEFAHFVEHFLKKKNISFAGAIVDVKLVNKPVVTCCVYHIQEILACSKKVSVIAGYADYHAIETSTKRYKEIIEKVYYLTSCEYDRFDTISKKYFEDTKRQWENMYKCLADDYSRKSLRVYLQTRLSNRIDYFLNFKINNVGYFRNDILDFDNRSKSLLDVGAFEGSAVDEFVDELKGYDWIIAVEPDKDNYIKLCTNIQRENVLCKMICASDKDGKEYFCGTGQEGGISTKNEGGEWIESQKIDTILEDKGNDVGVIKINFPFFIDRILDGAKYTMKKNKPQIIIRAGFFEEVLLQCFEKILEINPEYNIYLRYTVGIPQGLTIYAK